MSAARILLSDARCEGASFRLVGDRLRLVPAPGRSLPASLIERAKSLRAEIIAELTEDRRASVEKIYARMEAERERRRDWWARPVEGWRDGLLTMRNIARDETVIVDFRKWRSGR
jgi:hypothetical protein